MLSNNWKCAKDTLRKKTEGVLKIPGGGEGGRVSISGRLDY
jgi:hypothetical protein